METEGAYWAAHQEAQSFAHAEPGVILLRGRDRLDLLNRLTTNDLADLPVGRWKRTILTSALARIVDVVTVFSRPADILLLTSTGKAPQVKDWLNGYIFFQDEVEVSLPDRRFTRWGIYGPNASSLLSELQPLDPPQPMGHFYESPDGITWSIDRPRPGGFELLLQGEATARARETWPEAGDPAVQQAFDILRIESGLPRVGSEISEDTIPLEVGLWDEVSFNKGCYIGQEILARMESREQIPRRLVLLQLPELLPAGTRLLENGSAVGHLTSVAHSPRSGWIGLALVKPIALKSESLKAGQKGIEVFLLDPLDGARTRHDISR
ncbi:MAG: YgfZ/GcvT domain-containing protein [Anaerolineales bacterium]|jgi:folate-binding protein YgfZ